MQNDFWFVIHSTDRENAHTRIISPLTIEANDPLPFKSTKTHSISNNITLVLRCIQGNYWCNTFKPGVFVVVHCCTFSRKIKETRYVKQPCFKVLNYFNTFF